MDIYIHYTQLPQDKELADIVGELNEVLEEGGRVCGGEQGSLSCIIRIIFVSILRPTSSRPPVGSSNTNTSGLNINTDAMVTIFFVV